MELPPRTRRIPRICVDVFIDWELPPRTRRIPIDVTAAVRDAGTTSAYAENTVGLSWRGLCDWNYLRVRGEYANSRHSPDTTQELPPRTRRIPRLLVCLHVFQGTTSAYAENTADSITVPSDIRNYLRVRGEYRKTPKNGGTGGNYLRVRGEYLVLGLNMLLTMELPPRTRRIPTCSRHLPQAVGTTSAYAENTVGWCV